MNYSTDIDELQLLRKTARSDRTAFKQLFDRHGGKVYSVCLKISGNRQDAEDLTQDVFFTLWTKAKTIRGEAKLSTWLHRVAVNKAINLKKQGGAVGRIRKLISLDEHQEDGSRELAAPAGSQPDRQQEIKTARLELADLLATLPPKQREVYLLHKLEGFSYKEIAAELNLSLAAVESAMHRAKINLQKAMVKKFKKARKKLK